MLRNADDIIGTMEASSTPPSEQAKQLTAALGKLTPNLKPAKRFAADLPVIGISVAERLNAKVPAAEIAKTIHTVYGYKVTPERLARLVRPWRTQIKKDQQGSMTVPSATTSDQVNGGAA